MRPSKTKITPTTMPKTNTEDLNDIYFRDIVIRPLVKKVLPKHSMVISPNNLCMLCDLD